jgi:hypothetical protein
MSGRIHLHFHGRLRCVTDDGICAYNALVNTRIVDVGYDGGRSAGREDPERVEGDCKRFTRKARKVSKTYLMKRI